MTFNAGTATDSIDMLDQLVQVLTSRHVATITPTALGVDYTVGEILDLDNALAVFTHGAQIEVLSVDGSGVITSWRIYRHGAYSILPDLSSNATVSTGFTFAGVATTPGTGALFTLTFARIGWRQLTRRQEASTAIPAVGGTGYTASDVLTLVGGVLHDGGSAATFTVNTVSAGAVATVSVLAVGDYDIFPDNPVVTTGGTGTGCTLTVAPANVAGDTVLVLQGNGGSGQDPVVGIKAYSDLQDESSTANVANWAMFGIPGVWDNTKEMHDQTDISPGYNTSLLDGSLTTLSGTGSYVPLKAADAFDIKWTIRATGRNVTVVMEVESSEPTVYFAHASFGLLNQLAITSEIALPAYIVASSDRKKVWYKDTASIWGGITEPITLTDGPVYAYDAADGWLTCRVAKITSVTDITPDYGVDFTNPRCFVWPLGTGTTLSAVAADIIVDEAPTLGFDNDDLTLAVPTGIFRTPQAGGDVPPFFPVTLMQINAVTAKYRVFGEIDGVHWFHKADSAVTAFDRFVDGPVAAGLSTQIYRTVFRNGTQTELWSYFAVEEN